MIIHFHFSQLKPEDPQIETFAKKVLSLYTTAIFKLNKLITGSSGILDIKNKQDVSLWNCTQYI